MSHSRFTYYFTCMLSGAVELGTIFLGTRLGYSLSAIIGLAMAYQVGNVLRFFINKKIAKFQDLFIFLIFALSILSMLLKGSWLSYVSLLVYYTVFSTFLQNIRSAVQGQIPRWKKRSWRVAGFVFSAMFYLFPYPMLIASAMILLFYSITLKKFHYDGWLNDWKTGVLGPRLCWTMVTHQAHYFAYNYVILYLVLHYFSNPLIASLCFAANWIPYIITEPFVKKMQWDKWLAIAVCAHLFNAMVLLGMHFFFDANILLSITLWVLTGFGGGNVFCIKKALASRITYDKDVWSLSEQLGHILGVVTALIITTMPIPEKTTMLVAAFFAFITVPIMMLESGNRKCE